MYEYGIGVKQDADNAYVCLKEASDRGNVYAMGNLVANYYRRKLYTKAADLAARYITCIAIHELMYNISLIFRHHDFKVSNNLP